MRWKIYALLLACFFIVLSGKPSVSQVRLFCGDTDTKCWTTPNRPSNPGIGTFGYNITTATVEEWNGSAWVSFLSLSGGALGVGCSPSAGYTLTVCASNGLSEAVTTTVTDPTQENRALNSNFTAHYTAATPIPTNNSIAVAGVVFANIDTGVTNTNGHLEGVFGSVVIQGAGNANFANGVQGEVVNAGSGTLGLASDFRTHTTVNSGGGTINLKVSFFDEETYGACILAATDCYGGFWRNPSYFSRGPGGITYFEVGFETAVPQSGIGTWNRVAAFGNDAANRGLVVTVNKGVLYTLNSITAGGIFDIEGGDVRIGGNTGMGGCGPNATWVLEVCNGIVQFIDTITDPGAATTLNTTTATAVYTANSSTTVQGFKGTVLSQPANATTQSGVPMAGVYGVATGNGAGNTTFLNGVIGRAANASTGTITHATDFLGDTVSNPSGTITNHYVLFDNDAGCSSVVTNCIGAFLQNVNYIARTGTNLKYLRMGSGTVASWTQIADFGNDASSNMTLSLNKGATVTLNAVGSGGVFQTTGGTLNSNNDLTVGGGSANATNATSPFAFLTASAGLPTGVPTLAAAGSIAAQYDTTNLKLWLYDQPAANWTGVVTTSLMRLAPAVTGIYVLAQSHVGSSFTTTDTSNTETCVASIKIPGGAMGANGAVRAMYDWTVTANTNTKNVRVRHATSACTPGSAYSAGGGSVTAIGINGASAQSLSQSFVLGNRNSASSQISHAVAATAYWTSVNAVNYTAAINTGNDSYLNFAVQDAASGDTMTIEQYVIEIMPQS